MIYVFGSCVMDLLVPLPRLPRPGETVLGESYEMRPGGKGANQAVAAVRAGGLVSFFGAVGEDAFGRELRRSLEEEGIEPDGLAIVERPSAAALVMIGPNGENQIAVAAGANLEALAEQVPDAVLTSESLVVMQMEVRPEENWALLRRIRELGGRSMLNVAHRRESEYSATETLLSPPRSPSSAEWICCRRATHASRHGTLEVSAMASCPLVILLGGR